MWLNTPPPPPPPHVVEYPPPPPPLGVAQLLFGGQKSFVIVFTVFYIHIVLDIMCDILLCCIFGFFFLFSFYLIYFW